MRVEPDRFSAAWRLLEEREPAPAQSGSDTVIRADLIRPEDLLAVSIEAVGCALVDGDPPQLRSLGGDDKSFLIVSFPFQHIAEEAFYEGGTGIVPNELKPEGRPTPTLTPPLQRGPTRQWARALLVVHASCLPLPMGRRFRSQRRAFSMQCAGSNRWYTSVRCQAQYRWAGAVVWPAGSGWCRCPTARSPLCRASL